ncbi:MAG TPA: M67 family metallopeptidase [Acidimicrobiia bacterium]|nr:M67 family metallopeptidase [Acidimicrobiia bacterium]
MIRLDPQIREAILVHADNCHPEESCGLLASDDKGRVRMAYPLTNALHSPTNYTIEPREHFRALRHAEAQGWDISGVFHSHPHSAAYPSATDVTLAADPTWLYVVVGMERRDDPELRGFRITGGRIHEEPLTFEKGKPT